MTDHGQVISELLRSFRLPTASEEMASRLVTAGYDNALEVVREVLESEAEARRERRVMRLRKGSKLPPGKTFDTFNLNRLPLKLASRLRELTSGRFIDQAMNVLAFGLPGTGKSHAACALGHALVEAGRSVLFVPTFKLVQELLAAKRDLELPKALRKLDRYEVLMLDDIGYVKQTPDEIEVLFTLLAERYERRSVLITSNLVFSEWDKIFQNPMTTQAAIDRVVHHSVILEFDVLSFRKEHSSALAGQDSGEEEPVGA